VTGEKPPQRTEAGVDAPLLQDDQQFHKGRIRGGARTTCRITIACTSSGETLPPRGFASAQPLFSHRCSHLTAVLPAGKTPLPPRAAALIAFIAATAQARLKQPRPPSGPVSNMRSNATIVSTSGESRPTRALSSIMCEPCWPRRRWGSQGSPR
jgi:hypothetical protein